MRLRQASPEERAKYFQSVEDRRIKATEEQIEKWAWQKKQYGKGEDPIDEWRKRRANGQISDLENQYGDPKKIGGIPLPSASFGVGGEFGVGGKYDNGGESSYVLVDLHFLCMCIDFTWRSRIPSAGWFLAEICTDTSHHRRTGRFDLRLPYAEQGWVDEESDGNPFANLFGGGKKKTTAAIKKGSDEKTKETEPKKNAFWPF